jgi:NCS1 family nucleobase:cation symporter-1
MNFFCGFIVSAFIYWLLCKISPIPATSEHWLEVDEDVTGRNSSLVFANDTYDSERAYKQTYEDVKGVPKTE